MPSSKVPAAVDDQPATTLPHRSAGSNTSEVRVFHGVPILQKSFFWDGNGEEYDSGLGWHAIHFIADDAALGIGLSTVNWWTSGRDVQSIECDGLIRLYPVHSWPWFIEGGGGYLQSTHEIPPDGTQWNFTFGFGTGVDIRVSDSTSLVIGSNYHHISNALGRMNDRNPSQNECRFWIGFAWDF